MKRLLLALLSSVCVTSFAAEPLPESLKQGQFVIGCQAWTFNRFTVFEAIEKTAATGAKVIEFFPGQKLAPDQKDVKFDHNAPKEIWEKVQAKLKQHDITPVAYGVVGLSPTEADSRKVFEFAKFFGIRVPQYRGGERDRHV